MDISRKELRGNYSQQTGELWQSSELRSETQAGETSFQTGGHKFPLAQAEERLIPFHQPGQTALIACSSVKAAGEEAHPERDTLQAAKVCT